MGRRPLRYRRCSGGGPFYDATTCAGTESPSTSGSSQTRFQLEVHRETRTIPSYLLVIGRSGPKLKLSEAGGESAVRGGHTGHLKFRSEGIDVLVSVLWSHLERPVFDQTALQGEYDFDLDFDAERNEPASSSSSSAAGTLPTIFAAVQEQLGLKLEAKKVPVDLLVVDHVERPSAN